jgi:hypothetical protein
MRVGDRVRFRLYAGRIVEGVLRSVFKDTGGNKVKDGVWRGEFRRDDRP